MGAHAPKGGRRDRIPAPCAEYLATERLDALAHIQGAPGSGLPRVLFVRSHNAGRSH
ncbi:hypothetical protein ACFWOX_34855 [Streptomyces sp. NPDC058467]|uniref:hypothetical protein n=1 Tax=Streptomyces sp. NPDC058467 TaxID=3346513 RepID=UPI0036509E3F